MNESGLDSFSPRPIRPSTAGELSTPTRRKRGARRWPVILVATMCIGAGAACATTDDEDVAAEQRTELAERSERIDELTDEVARLEGDLDRATSTRPTTTEPPPTTTAPTTAPSTTAPPATAPPPTEPPADSATVSQRNARQKASDYLSFSPFSRTGLIEQLVFEGFSQEDATYGVDALTVDWNAQAASKAAEYLDFSSFSRSGLIDQLIFEGFTQAQAEYGVGTTGL